MKCSIVKCSIFWPLGWNTFQPTVFMGTRIRSGVSWFRWQSVDMDSGKSAFMSLMLGQVLLKPQEVRPLRFYASPEGLGLLPGPRGALF